MTRTLQECFWRQIAYKYYISLHACYWIIKESILPLIIIIQLSIFLCVNQSLVNVQISINSKFDLCWTSLHLSCTSMLYSNIRSQTFNWGNILFMYRNHRSSDNMLWYKRELVPCKSSRLALYWNKQSKHGSILQSIHNLPEIKFSSIEVSTLITSTRTIKGACILSTSLENFTTDDINAIFHSFQEYYFDVCILYFSWCSLIQNHYSLLTYIYIPYF